MGGGWQRGLGCFPICILLQLALLGPREIVTVSVDPRSFVTLKKPFSFRELRYHDPGMWGRLGSTR